MCFVASIAWNPAGQRLAVVSGSALRRVSLHCWRTDPIYPRGLPREIITRVVLGHPLDDLPVSATAPCSLREYSNPSGRLMPGICKPGFGAPIVPLGTSGISGVRQTETPPGTRAKITPPIHPVPCPPSYRHSRNRSCCRSRWREDSEESHLRGVGAVVGARWESRKP